MAVLVKVWDLPTRLFHWSLVVLLGLSWWSGEEGGLAFDTHTLSGAAVLALVLFRVVWGFIGGEYARFASFVRGPRRVWASLRDLRSPAPQPEAGHNPLGGWMILALLASLTVQVLTGLCANDDIMNEGPWAARVGDDWSDTLSAVHEANFALLLALIALHVLAVVYHRVRKGERLARAMVTGYKPLPAAPPRLREAPIGLALLLLAASAGIVTLLINL